MDADHLVGGGTSSRCAHRNPVGACGMCARASSRAGHGDRSRMPSDDAIAEAQAAYDRGEVTLLEATFLADALDAEGQEQLEPSKDERDARYWSELAEGMSPAAPAD
jgi:hypothetical protein